MHTTGSPGLVPLSDSIDVRTHRAIKVLEPEPYVGFSVAVTVLWGGSRGFVGV